MNWHAVFAVKKKTLLAVGTLPFGAILYFVAGWALQIDPDGPPEFIPTKRNVVVPISTVFIPVDVDATHVSALANIELSKEPLVEGSSAQLISNAVLNGLNLPDAPDVCTEKTIFRTITEDVKCSDLSGDVLKDIGKVGECVWNLTGGKVIQVTKSVVDTVSECAGIADLIDQLNPVPELAYRLTLDQINIIPDGDQFMIKAAATANLRLQLQGDTLRGLDLIEKQQCTLPAFVGAEVSLSANVVEEGVLLDPKFGEVDFFLGEGECNLAFFKDIDLNALNTVLQSEIGEKVKPTLRSLLIGAVGERTETPLGEDTVTHALANARNLLSNPLALSTTPPIWLSINADRMIISPDVTPGPEGENTIRVAGGVSAAPVLQIEDPGPSGTHIPLITSSENSRGFYVVPQAQISLDLVEQEATAAIRAYIAGKAPSLNYRNLSVRAYQSKDRLVLGVEMTGVTFLNFGVSFFITAAPRFSRADDVIFLDDLKLDIESNTEIVKRVGWYAETGLEAAPAPLMRFNVDTRFKSIVDALANFEYTDPSGVGTVHIVLQKLSLQEFWLNENVLHAAISAEGTASVDIDLHNF